jgi:hypothetical protein
VNTVVRAIIFIVILAAIVGGIVYVYTPMTETAAPPAAVEAPATPPAEPAPAPAPAEPTPPPAETPPATPPPAP